MGSIGHFFEECQESHTMLPKRKNRDFHMSSGALKIAILH